MYHSLMYISTWHLRCWSRILISFLITTYYHDIFYSSEWQLDPDNCLGHKLWSYPWLSFSDNSYLFNQHILLHQYSKKIYGICPLLMFFIAATLDPATFILCLDYCNVYLIDLPASGLALSTLCSQHIIQIL